MILVSKMPDTPSTGIRKKPWFPERCGKLLLLKSVQKKGMFRLLLLQNRSLNWKKQKIMSSQYITTKVKMILFT